MQSETITQSHTQIVIDPVFQKKLGQSFYNKYYLEADDSFVNWRDFGAVGKANSVIRLSEGFNFSKVVDIGCGLCNLISRLNKLNFGAEYYAIEVSPSAVSFIEHNVFIPKLKAVYLEDTTKTHFERDTFDLGILSHVLEHVPNPEVLLKEALRICKYVIIEVPLEDSLTANFYAKMLEIANGQNRRENSIGHINFFNKTSVKFLATISGGQVLRELSYRHQMPYQKHGLINFLKYLRLMTFYILGKFFGSRVIGCYYALLLKRK